MLAKKYKVFWWTLLLVLPFLVVFLSWDYIVGYDEAWQLQAANQLHKGLGYNSIWWQPQSPQIKPLDYTHLKGWPIGYSAIIAGLMYLGLGVLSSVKVVVTLFLSLGIYGWDRFHIRYCSPAWLTRILLLLYLVLSGMTILSVTTNLMVWAIFPFLLGTLHQTCTSPNRSYQNLLVASVLVSACILLRLQCIFLIPTIGLFLLFRLQSPVVKRIKTASLVCVLPVLVYVGIWYYNKIHTTSAAFLLYEKPSFAFNSKWFGLGITSVFLDPWNFIGFAPGAGIKTKLGGLFGSATFNLSLLFIGFLAMFSFVSFAKKDVVDQKEKLTYDLFTTFFVGNFLFLSGLSLFLYKANSEWVPIMEGRYFSFLFPLFIIIILRLFALIFGSISEQTKRTATALKVSTAVFGVACSIFFSVKYIKELEFNQQLKDELDTTLGAIDAKRDSTIFFVEGGLHAILLPEDKYSVYPVTNDSKNMYFDDRVRLNGVTTVVIVTCRDKASQFTTPIRGANNLQELATNLQMKRIHGKLINVYIKDVRAQQL